MAKWVSSNVLDNGLNYIKSNVDRMYLVKNYTAGDSYATVTGAANAVCYATLASTDFTLSGTSSRALATNATKTGTATIDNSGTNDYHVVFVKSTSSEVIWATDETSAGLTFNINDTITFPINITYTANQPT